MTYNYVTVSGTFPTLTGTVTFTPPNDVTDLTGTIPVLGPGPAVCTVSGGSFTSPPLLGTDNVGLLPAGWVWLLTAALTGKKAYSYPVLIPAGGGSTATLSSLAVSGASTTLANLGGAGKPTLTECATLYVATNGSDSSDGLTWPTALATVSHAISQMPVGGGIIEVGYGNFSISSPIVVSGTTEYGITIRGRGMGQTYDATNSTTSPVHPTAITNTGTGDAFQVTGTTSQAPPSYGFVLQDLAVIGSSSSANGLTASYGPRIKLQQVNFDQHGVWGLQFSNGCYWVECIDVICTRNGTVAASTPAGGMQAATGGRQFNLALFQNCIFNSNSGFGAYVSGGDAINFLNCDFSLTATSSASGSGCGCYLGTNTGAGPFTFYGSWFEKNATVGCNVQASVYANFHGCYFPGDSVSSNGIAFSGAGAASIIGCYFTGHTSYSVNNRFAAHVSWGNCFSGDSGFITVGAGTWNVNVPAGAATGTGSHGQGITAGLYNQTLGSAGAVTFDASAANTYVETLNANATSSSIINGAPGQNLTISWLQGAAGSFTYAWPSNCGFAGQSPPSASTSAGVRDSVTFYYDGTNWHEISRSIGSG